MAKLWSTKCLMGQDKREILVWNHMMNHCSFKSLIRLSKRGITPRKLRNIINSPLVLPAYLEGHIIGHVGPNANTQADQSVRPRRPYPGP